MIEPQQMEFASVAFPKDRRVLYVQEVAERLSISEQHVSDLIEEGRLQAIDISGGGDPIECLAVDLARRLNADPVIVRDAVAAARAQVTTRRKYWRVPVEAYQAFLKGNHSFNL